MRFNHITWHVRERGLLMHTNTQLATGLTRRSFLTGAVAAGALLAMAAGSSARASESASADASAGAAAQVYDSDTTGATQGGTMTWYLTNPVAIEPFGAEENQGVEVIFNLFDTLTTYDWEKGQLIPLAAESYESNDDATQFTFHLRKEATWHDGKPVTSKDFKYAWERLCRSDFKPAPSSLGYKLTSIKGADEMMKGEATELDVECPDDYTFVVNLKAPFAEFDAAVGDMATAPVPAGCTDTEEDFQKFRLAPIGNGPFMMDGEWNDGQYINIKRYDGYWGEKPFIDGVNFQIFKDDQTAWTEFQAGNLDFTTIPSGTFTLAQQSYGLAEKDGYVANPGKQTFLGEETSIYYLLINNEDDVMSNKDLRIAVSYAINRKAICDSVLQGTKSPASNMIAPGVPGAEENGWDYCLPEGDKDKAAEYFDKAGYPLGSDGKRGLSLTLSTNSGSANESIMTMIQADLAACGVDSTIDVQEWAAYIDAVQGRTYQMGRLGWTIQVPTPYLVLQPLFYTGSGDNNSGYTNPDFDAAIDKAFTVTDTEERVEAFKEANKIVAADFPVVPLFYYLHTYVASARVNNLFFNPSGYGRLTRCWLSA